MSDAIQKKQAAVKEDEIVIQYLDVNPEEAGWHVKYDFRKQFNRRVFLQNIDGNRASLQMSMLRDMLGVALGDEGMSYELVDAQQDMIDYWNRSSHDEDAFLHGNSIMCTEVGYAAVQMLMADESHPDHKYTFAKVTIVEKRNDV